MRIKGISWIEQHFEKLVAAVFGAALLGVLAWQFGAPQGATVKINNAEVPITAANEKLGEIARGAKGRIEQNEAPVLEGADKLQSSLSAAASGLKGPVAPGKELDAPLGEVATIQSDALPSGSSKGAAGVPKFAAIAPSAPTRPIAASNLSCISPLEARDPEVAKVLPSALPYDLGSVSVETTFSGADLKTAITSDPDGDGPLNALPSSVVDSGRIQILLVEGERQELQADGAWSEPTPVAPIPGRFTLAAEVGKTMGGVTALDAYVKLAAERSTDVRRPAYYAIFQGEDWIPPTERTPMNDDADKGRQIDRMKREYTDKHKRLMDARDELAKLPPPDSQGGGRGSAPRPAAPPAGGGGVGGGGVGGGGRGGGRDAPPAPTPRDPTPSPAQAAAKRRNLERSIENLQRDLARLLTQLKAQNANISDLPIDNADPNAAPTDPMPMPSAKADGPLLDDPAVRLWIHDVRAARGKTYRYRLRLVFSNPLFMQFNQLGGEQQDLAKQPIIRGGFSEWSEPVTTEANQYYFVTGANVPDALQRTAGARVELYAFQWGYWRRASSQLEPGDRVHATARNVTDFTKLAEAMLADAPAQPNPNDGAGNPPSAPVGGGGGVGAGGGRGGGRRDGRDAPSPRPGDAPSGDPNAMPVKASDIPMRELEVALDAVLLGVGVDPVDSAAGGGRERLVAYFRDSGTIVPRIAESDAGTPTLRKLRASADKGEKALKPKPQPAQPDGTPRDPRPTRDPVPDAPAPAGGGGAGQGGG